MSAAPEPPDVVELRGISKRFDKTVALNEISLSVQKGECLVLAGPSGAGKTTILRVIAGLERADDGTVMFEGKPATKDGPWARGVGMTFEHYALYPHLSVHDNIAFPLRSKRAEVVGMAASEVEDRIRQITEMLGIYHLLDRQTDQLSGGQRQRVSLARCLVRDASIYLLDEPLAHLDAKLRMSMRTEFKRMVSGLQATMIYVTHDYREAFALGDRIAVIRDGVIEQVGTQEEIFEQPSTLFVARFVGNPPMNIVGGFVEDGLVRVARADDDDHWALGALNVHSGDAFEGGPVWLGIRPMDCLWDGSPGRGLSATVRTIKVQQDAAQSVIADTGREVIQATLAANAHPAFGEKIDIQLDLSKILVFDQNTERRLGDIAVQEAPA